MQTNASTATESTPKKYDPTLFKQPEYQPDTLLDTVIKHLGVKNDASLARALDIAPPLLSKVRHRKVFVGATLLLRMHEATDIQIGHLCAMMDHRNPAPQPQGV